MRLAVATTEQCALIREAGGKHEDAGVAAIVGQERVAVEVELPLVIL